MATGLRQGWGRCAGAAPLGIVLAGVLMGLAGCGAGFSGRDLDAASKPGVAMGGHVIGGQQPVSGAQIYLYAIGTTDGAPAVSLLASPGYVVTDANGNWSITATYTCPANAYVYVLALGGNPGLPKASANNAKLSLASLLGACSSLNGGQFFTVNEVSTVVAASALANIATSETQIAATDPDAIVNAATRNTNLLDPSSGRALLVTPDRTGSVPQAKINSLADAIASCVNSDGTNPNGPCQALMDNSGLSNTSLTPDTFNASLVIAQQPTYDPYDIYDEIPSSPPFEPVLADSPDDWILAPQYSGGGGSNGGNLPLTPHAATIAPNGQVAFTTASGTSFHWSTSGALGTLTDANGVSGQTNFCSTSNQATYVSNGASLTAPASDEVMVQQFFSSGCSGTPQGYATAAVTTAPPATVTTLPHLPSEGFTATVQLPGGVNLPLDSLTVVDSITQTTPASSGTFTIPKYSGGPQIVIVDAPDGTPMLLGWMDANHSVVSASTTAEVLLYYALGGASMLSEADREATIAQIPQIQDFNTLEQVIESELDANVDAFAQHDATLRAALNSLFTETTGYATQAKTGKIKPNDVTISPDPSTPQSGVTLSNTEPASGTTSTVTPFSTFLTNAYRRRTHYFVTKQKDTLNGQDTTSGAAVSDADLSPTVGVNGGVTGALTDIIKAYFGNQPTAYAPVTSDPINLPVDSGFDSTTYQIINVGPGASGAPRPVALTDSQQATLVITSVNGFVFDALIPFVNNVIVNAANDADSAGNTPVSGSATSAFAQALAANISSVVNQLPGEQDKLVAGDYAGTLGDLFFNAGTLPLVNSAIKGALASALPTANGGAALDAVGKFEGILNAAGAGLQVFDTAVYSTQLAGSDNVDVWTVTSTKFKATLSPAATTLNKVGSVQLQANVLNAPSSAQLSYLWTITPQSGQGLVGTITEVGGAGRTLPDANGNTSACSSSATWGYANNAATFQALTVATTDTVAVTAYQGANCSANPLTNQASATITNNANPQVAITPATSTIEAGEYVALTANFTDPKAATQPVPASWSWQLQGAAGTVYGTLGNGDGTVSANLASFCSTSNSATYTSTESDPVTAAESDQVNATAYAQAGCQGSPMNTQPGTATITTRSTPGFTITPTHATLQAGASVTFSLNTTSVNTAGFSYQWGTSGQVGTITDPASGNTGLLGVCTTSNSVTFATDPNASVKVPVTDFVVVGAFEGAGCIPDNEVGQPLSAQVTLQPTPSVARAPTQLLGQMLASDGFVYAVGPYLAPPSQGELNFPAFTSGDTIFRVQADGSVTAVVSFTHNVYDSYNNRNVVTSDLISPLVEGPDDALYGVAGDGGGSDNMGYFFKFSLVDQSVTILHVFSKADGAIGSGPGTDQNGNPTTVTYYLSDLQGPLLLADDGNFYVAIGGGGLVRLTPAGQVSIVYRDGGNSNAYGPLLEASDGNLYTTHFSSDSTGAITTSLVQMSLNGVATSVYTFDTFSYLFDQPNTPLVAGSDGALYGTWRGERPGNGACEFDYSKPDPNNHNFYSCTMPVHEARIFRFDPHGTFSSLYTFNSLSDGTTPLVGMVAGPDGNLYGAASAGGDLDSECTLFDPSHVVAIGQQVAYTSNGSAVYGPVGPIRVSDEGCGTIFRISPAGAYTKMYQFQEGPEGHLSLGTGNYADGGFQQDANLALDNAGDLLGSSAYSQPNSYNDYNSNVTETHIFKLPLFNNGPIQMSFNQSAVPVGTAVTLTWNVSNAFSLSAQQCYAHGVSGGGGGNWTGKQMGINDSSGYHGSATLTPTVAGTYYYALTCGGTQSSVAVLTVQ